LAELDNLANLAEQGSLGCQPALGYLAGSGKAPGNQAEVRMLVCLVGPPLEVISQLLGEEALARCIPDQEVGIEAAQMNLQVQGRVGERMVGVCHLEKNKKK